MIGNLKTLKYASFFEIIDCENIWNVLVFEGCSNILNYVRFRL